MTSASRRHRVLAALLAAFFVAAAPVVAQQSTDDPSGTWSGSLEAGGQTLEITVVLQATATGDWTGAIDIPAQNLTSFPLTDISVQGDAVSFAMAAAPGDPVFRGTWDAAELKMSGNLHQGDQAFPFSLARVGAAPATSAEPIDPATAAVVVGTWRGAMTSGGQTLSLVFHIDASPEGVLSATLDSPDQGQTGMPVNRVTFDGSVLILALDYVGAAYEGTLSDDGGSFAGAWSQGGMEVPLRMEKQ